MIIECAKWRFLEFHLWSHSCVFQHFVRAFEWLEGVLLVRFAKIIGNYCIFIRFVTWKLAAWRAFSLPNPSFSSRKRLLSHLGQVDACFFNRANPTSAVSQRHCQVLTCFQIKWFKSPWFWFWGQVVNWVGMFFSTYPSRNQWCLYALPKCCFHVFWLCEHFFSVRARKMFQRMVFYTEVWQKIK